MPSNTSRRQPQLPTNSMRTRRGGTAAGGGGEEEEQEEKFENPHVAAGTEQEDQDQGEEQHHGASTGGGGEGEEGSGSGSEEDSEEDSEDEGKKFENQQHHVHSESESESESTPFVDMGDGVGASFNPEDTQQWEEGEGEDFPPPALDTLANAATQATGTEEGADDTSTEEGADDTCDDAESNGEGAAPATLDTINPPDPRYQPPVQPADKGKLQEFYEDQSKLDPKSKQQYILTVASSLFGRSLVDLEPYPRYHELSSKRKGRGNWKSLKPSKYVIVAELNRRAPEYKANASNRKIVALMAELSNPTFDTLTEADKAFVKHEERVGSSLASMSRSRAEEGVQRSIDAVEDLCSKRMAVQEKLYTDARDAPDEYKSILCKRIEDLEKAIEQQEEFTEQAKKRLKKTH